MVQLLLLKAADKNAFDNQERMPTSDIVSRTDSVGYRRGRHQPSMQPLQVPGGTHGN